MITVDVFNQRWKIIDKKTKQNIYIKNDGIYHQNKPKYYKNLDELKKDILLNKKYFGKLKDSYEIRREKTVSTSYSIEICLGGLIFCKCCTMYKDKDIISSYDNDDEVGICFDCKR